MALAPDEFSAIKRIAVFRMGHIGDMVVTLPSFWTVRRVFPTARITLLAQLHQKGKLAQGVEVIPTGLVYDDVISYELGRNGVSFLESLKAIVRLRRQKFDLLVYLAADRTNRQLKRDQVFFWLCGVKKIIGLEPRFSADPFPSGTPLPRVEQEADRLRGFLTADGLFWDAKVPELFDVGLSEDERAEAERFLSLRGLEKRTLVSIGAGGKLPVNWWPIRHYQETVRLLDEAISPTFLLFGSSQESILCHEIAKVANSAIVLAGVSSIRESMALLERCAIHIGNDTATLHMAAAVSTPSIGIFTSKDWPGRWYPYGEGHETFRTPIACEGCLLDECSKPNKCIDQISPIQVARSALKMLNRLKPR
jgi:heptosyltransferase-3